MMTIIMYSISILLALVMLYKGWEKENSISQFILIILSIVIASAPYWLTKSVEHEMKKDYAVKSQQISVIQSYLNGENISIEKYEIMSRQTNISSTKKWAEILNMNFEELYRKLHDRENVFIQYQPQKQ